MYCHLEIVALSHSGAGLEVGWRLPCVVVRRELVWGTGCPRRSWERKQIPCTQSAPVSQRGLGLDLRRIQEQQEVGKRRQSKNSSLYRGLATQELGPPQCPIS